MNDIFTPKGECQKCHKRKATLLWSGNEGMIGVIHGAYQYWCERCALEAQIAYAEEHKNDLDNLKKKLSLLK